MAYDWLKGVADEYDVIVIGAGPAGAATGTLLAEQGHSVLILERSTVPRFHIGESLIPETYWSLQRLGLDELLEQVLLVADPSGASWVVTLSGLSRAGNGEGDARHHARLAELAPGQAILYVDHPAEPTEAPTRLDDARAAAAQDAARTWGQVVVLKGARTVVWSSWRLASMVKRSMAYSIFTGA